MLPSWCSLTAYKSGSVKCMYRTVVVTELLRTSNVITNRVLDRINTYLVDSPGFVIKIK